MGSRRVQGRYRRKGGAFKSEIDTYLVDGVEILAKIREIDVGLDDILQSHISSLENSFQVLDNLSGSVLDL